MFIDLLSKSGAILVILVFLAANLSAQVSKALLPVKVGGKWGFIDREGKITIPPQYKLAKEFSEGLAPVWKDAAANKCGYINDKGRSVTDPKFDFCGPHKEGFAVVKLQNKYRYIDKNGNFLNLSEWQTASAFSNGMARVGTGEIGAERYGFIDKRGRIIISPKFTYADDFHGGLALAAVDHRNGLKIGFIDRQGRWKIKPAFGSATSFSDGYACVTKEGASSLFEGLLIFDSAGNHNNGYYIDSTGKRAFGGNFRACGDFSNGLAPVVINDKWCYINDRGTVIFTTDFTSAAEAAPFSEGLATINFANGAKFIDQNGKVIIDTSFNWAESFAEGIARVKNVQTTGLESYGYIDKKGNVIWKPSN